MRALLYPALILALLPVALLGDTYAFTEFYCDAATGSNLNGGAPIGGAYPITYASGTWVATTGVFTVASGNPVSDGVTVGDFASVYADGASAPTGFVGRVTARDATTITVSLTAVSGTPPTDGTGNRTVKVGGAWKGPNAADGFPLSFVAATLTNVGGDAPRVNLKSGTDYQISSAITAGNAGPIRFQGYTTTVADGGRFTLDAQANAIVPLTISGTNVDLADAIITVSAGSGSNAGLTLSAAGVYVRRVVVHGARGAGFNLTSGALVVESEAYDNNKSNTAATGGFIMNASNGAMVIRSISHDNAGSNSSGFEIKSTGSCVGCIADSNGGDGFRLSPATPVRIVSFDAYNNAGAGVHLANTAAANYYLENGNLVKNTGYGINGSGSGARSGAVINCGLGSGTQANGGTTTGLKSMAEIGSVTYTADALPWTDAPNGDFRVTLAAAKNAGRGAFTQTATSYSGTVGYPDIGSAQHQSVAGGGTRVY